MCTSPFAFWLSSILLIYQVNWFFSSAISSLSNKPIKSMLHLCYCTFNLQHFFWVLRIPSVYIVYQFLHATLANRALSISITVLFNSWYDRSDIAARPDSDTCSMSSHCGVIFPPLIATYDILSERNCCNLVLWW